MKAIVFFVALFLAANAASVSMSSLIGVWTLSDNSTEYGYNYDEDECCMPAGDLIINNNTATSATFTSTSWAGLTCAAKINSTTIDISDASSSNPSGDYSLSLTSGTLTLSFLDKTTGSPVTNCTNNWVFANYSDGASMMTLSVAGLAALVLALIN